jgi:hypothetical protein
MKKKADPDGFLKKLNLTQRHKGNYLVSIQKLFFCIQAVSHQRSAFSKKLSNQRVS